MRPDVLRLVTANAAAGRSAEGPPDLGPFADAAAALAPDVLAVQEVDHLLPRSSRVDQTRQLTEAVAGGGSTWYARFAATVHGTPGNVATMRPAPTTDPAEPSYGIALLSRHPVLAWWEHRMAPSWVKVPVARPSWTDEDLVVVGDEQRVALAARVRSPGGPVTVVTTHLSFVPWRAVAQLRELVTWARELPRPLVLLGDLNLPGRVPARLTRWTPVVTGPTYPAERPRARLDHVLLDPGSTALHAVGEADVHRLASSDHLAVAVDVAPGR